jgi:hypothetical protein
VTQLRAGSAEVAEPARPAPACERDTRYMSKLAERYLIDLEERSRSAPRLTRAQEVLRVLSRFKQWLHRKVKELIQEHWDLAVFDVTFGSLKAFVIYPGLYFAGLVWTIPIMEYIPLNTQVWTAGYLFCRRHILSVAGRLRYGHSLNRLNALRDEVLGIHPRDTRHIHRFEDGFKGTVRTGRSRLADWVRRCRRMRRERNVILQSELRGMVGDREFLWQANELRNNTWLYQEILIKKILSSPEGRMRLRARLVSEKPLRDEAARRLRDTIGESLVPSLARVIEQGNALTETLKRNLGHKFSATSLAIRWINWSYQRAAYRRLAQLDVLHYRLLAGIVDGTPVEDSEHLAPIRHKREEIQTWMERAAAFGTRAKAAMSKAEAHRVIEAGIAEAHSFGRRVRLARLAYRLSPSARAGV